MVRVRITEKVTVYVAGGSAFDIHPDGEISVPYPHREGLRVYMTRVDGEKQLHVRQVRRKA